jgi:hypothetical protein
MSYFISLIISKMRLLYIRLLFIITTSHYYYNPFLAHYLFPKLILYIELWYMFMNVYKYIHTTLNRLKPNPMIHKNTKCTWIGGLVT